MTSATLTDASLTLDTEAVARRVVIRLRNTEGPPVRAARRGTLRWVSGLAAAAALAIALGTGDMARPHSPTLIATNLVLLPELSDLTPSELEGVLAEIPPASTELATATGTGLSDLTDDELERILLSLEG